jgi:hypothetical protein
MKPIVHSWLSHLELVVAAAVADKHLSMLVADSLQLAAVEER